MAGAANAILASPVEMFKVRMQAQYGNPSDKRLRVVAKEMWAEWGFRKGVMRGYWVRRFFFIGGGGGFWFLKLTPFVVRSLLRERFRLMQGEASSYDCCPTKRPYSRLNSNSGMLSLGSIQVGSEHALSFRCQKSRSIRILEAKIREHIWARSTSMGTIG
jgi:transmembrane carrier protein